MPDKTSRAIIRLLSRPGLARVTLFRRGSDVHVEGVSENEGILPRGTIVPDGGESTLVDALDCLDACTWEVGGEPPDQLAEAEVQPMVWLGESVAIQHWMWWVNQWLSVGSLGRLNPGELFVPGHHPKPTINPSEMSTIETCKEIWND